MAEEYKEVPKKYLEDLETAASAGDAPAYESVLKQIESFGLERPEEGYSFENTSLSAKAKKDLKEKLPALENREHIVPTTINPNRVSQISNVAYTPGPNTSKRHILIVGLSRYNTNPHGHGPGGPQPANFTGMRHFVIVSKPDGAPVFDLDPVINIEDMEEPGTLGRLAPTWTMSDRGCDMMIEYSGISQWGMNTTIKVD